MGLLFYCWVCWTFCSYSRLFITTVALPLSAGIIRMSSSPWSCLIALLAERFEEGGLAWERMLTIRKRAETASSSGTLLRPLSKAAIISLYGIQFGVGVKFRPFSRTACSSGCNSRLKRFTTQRSEELGPQFLAASFPFVRVRRFSNFCFCLDLHFFVSLDSVSDLRDYNIGLVPSHRL